MNRIKRITALIGVFLLAFMYILTLFAAVFGDAKTSLFFEVSLALTIFIPCLIWILGLFVRINKKEDTIEENNEENN